MSEQLYIDVRTKPEYQSGHVPGAVHVPLHKVTKFMDQLDDAVFVCRTGKRAGRACRRVEGHDSTGVEQYAREGNTLEYEAPTVWPMDRQVRLGAGALVLAGTALGLFVNPWFYAIPAFVGAGLAFSGLTGTCGMAKALARMPWNSRSDQEISRELSARTP